VQKEASVSKVETSSFRGGVAIVESTSNNNNNSKLVDLIT